MTTREELHQPEKEELDAAALQSLYRGLSDVAAGRVKPLAQYMRERGLQS